MRHRRRFVIALAVIAGVSMAVGAAVILNPFGVAAAAEARVLAAGGQEPGECSPGHLRFYYGFASLQTQLGERMGQPIECEQSIHANGDTRQRTTTGYAYYRKLDNVPTFTDGWEHWALTTDGLVYWTGDVVDPPTARH
jgi:hypothetical protein